MRGLGLYPVECTTLCTRPSLSSTLLAFKCPSGARHSAGPSVLLLDGWTWVQSIAEAREALGRKRDYWTAAVEGAWGANTRAGLRFIENKGGWYYCVRGGFVLGTKSVRGISLSRLLNARDLG